MAARRILPIETVPFVGGVICLDFINTTGARAILRPRERLTCFRDLTVFCSRTKLLDKACARALLHVSEKEPLSARKALAHMIKIREMLYRIFVAVARRTPATKADVALFNKELAEASRRRALAWIRGMPRWIWVADPADLEPMAGPILFSAAELLGSPNVALVKQCGVCDWLFLDTTRNHRRRWCKKLCGDRVKAQRYYRRHKGAGA